MVHRSLLVRRYLMSILLLGCSIFLILSLSSFNMHDISPYQHIASTRPVTISNVCGVVGSFVAAFLFHLLGSAAFLLIPLLFLCGWLSVFGRRFFFDVMHGVGLICMLVFWTLFTALSGGDFCCVGYPGGAVGHWLLKSLSSGVDAIVLISGMIALFSIGIVLLIRFSWVHALCCALKWCWKCVGGDLIKERLFASFVLPLQRWISSLRYSCKKTFSRLKSLLLKAVPFSEGEKDVRQNEKEENSIVDALFERFKSERSIEQAEEVFDEEFWIKIQKDLGDVGELRNVEVPTEGDSQGRGISSHSSIEFLREEGELGDVVFYEHPSASLLKSQEPISACEREKTTQERVLQLEEKLRLFGIEGRVLSTTIGPVVTLFEYAPAENIKISRIVGLEDDLTLALGALSLRVIAPLPGKQAVGFEVANGVRDTVSFLSCVTGRAFTKEKYSLPLIIGRDTKGEDVVVDLANLPHLLVAGSTGSGKSVALHTMLMSLLYACSPDELKLVLIDPKRLEFAAYADIAHLLIPVVTDVPRVPKVLTWLTQVMDERYRVLAQSGLRSAAEFRALQGVESMPSIVVVIDELADIMMVAKKEVEPGLARLAQMARAAGIYLIVATQRPSVDVLTGLIKVNFPARIAFKVASKVDSRTILDQPGAEKLLGKGDLLFLHPKGTCERIQGAFVHDSELQSVLAHIRAQRSVEYEVFEPISSAECSGQDALDPLFCDVERFVKSVEEVSISLIQRKFRIGYNRSARLIDLLEARGIILPALGGKMRKVVKDLSLS